jgi:hypothetical protein
VRPASALVVWYEARREGELVGVGWLDVHVVRTKQQALLVVLEPDGRVARIDVLAFEEPREYRAPPRWLAQFAGRTAADGLKVGGGIHGLGGATLTARAVTQTVRLATALDAVARRGRRAAGAPQAERP